MLTGLFPADTVKTVNLQGCSSKGLVSELTFDFSIETLGEHRVLHHLDIIQQIHTNKS